MLHRRDDGIEAGCQWIRRISALTYPSDFAQISSPSISLFPLLSVRQQCRLNEFWCPRGVPESPGAFFFFVRRVWGCVGCGLSGVYFWWHPALATSGCWHWFSVRWRNWVAGQRAFWMRKLFVNPGAEADATSIGQCACCGARPVGFGKAWTDTSRGVVS